MNCSRCDVELADDEGRAYHSEMLCEDCYLDAAYPVKACDPWAVYTAKRTRQTAGQSDAEGLTELQRDLYQFIKSRQRVTAGELAEQFRLPADELRNQLAILRHCELVKGHKEGTQVFLVPFDQD